MDLNCLNTIITDNLAVHIDLTSLKSWNLNTGYTSVSLNKWAGAVSDNIFLYDFGLTAFDNGRVDHMHDTLTITPSDNKVTLYRIGYNNSTGGTFYTPSGITAVTALTATTVGNYFQLNGDYLQGFFKLKDYNYELIPARYGKGITIETLINISEDSFNDGYFYLMGARAESKYIPPFSGESSVFSSGYTEANGKHVIEKAKIVFSGVTTSEGHYLNNYVETEVLKTSINSEKYFDTLWVENDDNGINNNVIGFFISSDQRIGFTRINNQGLIETQSSDNLLSTGWTLITIVFKPYEIITDTEVLKCTPSRKGDFTIYVNGRRFWKIEDFDEYYFKGFKTQKEKQLGVPYNISWGGGSFGLRHSHHYDLNTRTIFNGNSELSVGTGFTFINNPNPIDSCELPNVSGFTQYVVVTGDNTTFTVADECGTGTTGQTVLKIHNTGTTTGLTTNEYYLQFNEEYELLSNRDYIFTVQVYDAGIFTNNDGVIGLFFSGSTGITVVEAINYNQIGYAVNTWNQLRYKIRTTENTGLSTVKVGLYMKSAYELSDNFLLYFNEFSFVGPDKLTHDIIKDDQTIENTYSQSFVGSIQKLRIYDTAFNSQMVLHNASIESRTAGYNMVVNRGGRIING